MSEQEVCEVYLALETGKAKLELKIFQKTLARFLNTELLDQVTSKRL